jgi:hypothetical protein
VHVQLVLFFLLIASTLVDKLLGLLANFPFSATVLGIGIGNGWGFCIISLFKIPFSSLTTILFLSTGSISILVFLFSSPSLLMLGSNSLKLKVKLTD